MRIEFVPSEVGTHIIEASVGGTKLVGGPLIAKVYDAGLIQVTDVNGGVVGQPCQFRGVFRGMSLNIKQNADQLNDTKDYNIEIIKFIYS